MARESKQSCSKYFHAFIVFIQHCTRRTELPLAPSSPPPSFLSTQKMSGAYSTHERNGSAQMGPPFPTIPPPPTLLLLQALSRQRKALFSTSFSSSPHSISHSSIWINQGGCEVGLQRPWPGDVQKKRRECCCPFFLLSKRVRNAWESACCVGGIGKQYLGHRDGRAWCSMWRRRQSH